MRNQRSPGPTEAELAQAWKEINDGDSEVFVPTTPDGQGVMMGLTTTEICAQASKLAFPRNIAFALIMGLNLGVRIGETRARRRMN